jgi:hypothetical protein
LTTRGEAALIGVLPSPPFRNSVQETAWRIFVDKRLRAERRNRHGKLLGRRIPTESDGIRQDRLEFRDRGMRLGCDLEIRNGAPRIAGCGHGRGHALPDGRIQLAGGNGSMQSLGSVRIVRRLHEASAKQCLERPVLGFLSRLGLDLRQVRLTQLRLPPRGRQRNIRPRPNRGQYDQKRRPEWAALRSSN